MGVSYLTWINTDHLSLSRPVYQGLGTSVTEAFVSVKSTALVNRSSEQTAPIYNTSQKISTTESHDAPAPINTLPPPTRWQLKRKKSLLNSKQTQSSTTGEGSQVQANSRTLLYCVE